MIELIVDGYTVEHLSYADRSGAGGSAGPPAAFIALARGAEREFRYVPEDDRGYSHRALVALLRERPHIWKHRSPESAASSVSDAGPATEWNEPDELFPDSLPLDATRLRGVVAVNQSQAIEAITVSATSLERFEDGARLRLLVQDDDLDRRSELCAMDVVAVDDRGRMYRVATNQTARGMGAVDAEILVGPAPPRDVGRLTVAVGAVGDVDDAAATVSGPWIFPIELGPPA